MVTCKCGKQLLWTTGCRVACPAGHTMQFDVAGHAADGAPGTPYTGDAASLRIAPIPDAVNLQEEGAAPRGSFEPGVPLGFRKRVVEKGGEG